MRISERFFFLSPLSLPFGALSLPEVIVHSPFSTNHSVHGLLGRHPLQPVFNSWSGGTKVMMIESLFAYAVRKRVQSRGFDKGE